MFKGIVQVIYKYVYILDLQGNPLPLVVVQYTFCDGIVVPVQMAKWTRVLITPQFFNISLTFYICIHSQLWDPSHL